MSGPILATKLYIPLPRPEFVPRPRLVERIDEALSLGRKLILISAPSGFGKTALVSDWIAGSDRRTAWLSLDEGDNEPTHFLAYLLAALQSITPNIGEGMLNLLQSPQPPPTEAILTSLINEISAISDIFVLVLDDYHLIEDQLVDTALSFLLENIAPQMQLVIATRENPPLPLARYRAQGNLTELRAAGMNRWLVIGFVSFVLSIQHMFFTFQLDWRYDLWLAVKFLPFAFWTGWSLIADPQPYPILCSCIFC